MEVLICFTALWLLWLVRPKFWKKRFVQPLIAALTAVLIVVSPAFSSLMLWGLTAGVSSDSGEPAQMIVVLGRGSSLRNGRVAAVWNLWQAKRASHIFASGMMDARAIVKDLQTIGIPDASLSGEECSQSTEENALFAAALLRKNGVRTIVIVTDLAHMWRSLLTFRSFGFHVIPHAVPLESQTLNSGQKLRLLVREYAGMLVYALSGKFSQRSKAELDNPPPQVLQKISEWNCQVP